MHSGGGVNDRLQDTVSGKLGRVAQTCNSPLRKWRQEDQEFKAILSILSLESKTILGLCLNKTPPLPQKKGGK